MVLKLMKMELYEYRTSFYIPRTSGSQSYKLSLPNGFNGDITWNNGEWSVDDCRDIDECSINNGGCSAHADCIDLNKGEVSCICKTGFTGDG